MKQANDTYTVQVYYGPSSRLPGDKHWQDVVHCHNEQLAKDYVKLFAEPNVSECRIIHIASPIYDGSNA